MILKEHEATQMIKDLCRGRQEEIRTTPVDGSFYIEDMLGFNWGLSIHGTITARDAEHDHLHIDAFLPKSTYVEASGRLNPAGELIELAVVKHEAL